MVRIGRSRKGTLLPQAAILTKSTSQANTVDPSHLPLALHVLDASLTHLIQMNGSLTDLDDKPMAVASYEVLEYGNI